MSLPDPLILGAIVALAFMIVGKIDERNRRRSRSERESLNASSSRELTQALLEHEVLEPRSINDWAHPPGCQKCHNQPYTYKNGRTRKLRRSNSGSNPSQVLFDDKEYGDDPLCGECGFPEAAHRSNNRGHRKDHMFVYPY